jgi:hypothetical protein
MRMKRGQECSPVLTRGPYTLTEISEWYRVTTLNSEINACAWSEMKLATFKLSRPSTSVVSATGNGVFTHSTVLRRLQVWRKLHVEELNDLYFSPNIVGVQKSRMWLAEHVVRMGKRRGIYRVLVGRPEWKTRIGLHKCRCDYLLTLCSRVLHE